MSKAKLTLRLVITSGLIAVGAVAPASAAYAVPSGCSSGASGNGYTAYCSSGTGQYRAYARCYNAAGTSYTTRYGLWRSPGGSSSTATCTSSEDVGGGGIEKR